MSNQDHLNILKQGIEIWNKWRLENPLMRPDLSGADLRNTELSGVHFGLTNLVEADLSGADLALAQLNSAKLTSAKLVGTDLSGATLQFTMLKGANLQGSILYRTSLMGAVLIDANLRGANLMTASLVSTKLTRADLTGCFVYGISVWDVDLEHAKQNNLVITPEGEPIIKVDNLKVAQFIYLLLNNAEIRDVINILTTKTVLILGRFPGERTMVLEALKEVLRDQNYSPIVLNIEETENRDFTATVRTLANMVRFVLFDLTDLNQAIHEIADDIVPHCIVPIRPLFQASYQQTHEFFQSFSANIVGS